MPMPGTAELTQPQRDFLRRLTPHVRELERQARGFYEPWRTVKVTAAYTVAPLDRVVLADAVGGAFAVTLPVAAEAAERLVVVKRLNAGANAVTVTPAAVAETIDGTATLVLPAQYATALLVSNGVTWEVMGQSAQGGAGWAIVKKTADQNRASTITLADDSALTLALPVGNFRIRGFVFMQAANATMDYKYALAFTGTHAGARCRSAHAACGAVLGTDNESTLAQNAASPTIIASTPVTGATSGTGYVEFDVLLQVTAAGTFSFQWAQNTSDAGNLTCAAGSYFEYTPF